MRTRTLLAVITLAACGKVETPTADAHGTADAHPSADAMPTTDAPPPTWTNSSGWNCASNTACEDVYDVTFTGDDVLSVVVSGVSSESMARLAVFAGTATTGTNLVTNTGAAACGSGQGTSISSGAINVSAGTYAIAVGRDWELSAGASGTYTVTVSTTHPFVAPVQNGDDVASNQANCP